MPWVAWLALVGTLAIAGLPPLNGFVSEWLLLQAFLFTPSLPQSFVNMLVPVAAAALVLAVALAGLRDGQVLRRHLPRPAARAEPRRRARRRACSSASAWSGWRPAASLLGVLPVAVIALLDPVNAHAARRDRVGASARAGWLLLAPISAGPRELQPADRAGGDRRRRAADDRRSCTASTTAACAARRRGTAASRCRRRACRTPPKASASRSARCSSRSSACERAAAHAVRRRAALRGRRSRTTSGTGCTCRSRARPSAGARSSALLQQGRISVYLIYSFVTLLALLFFVR